MELQNELVDLREGGGNKKISPSVYNSNPDRLD
jgi:hypothetical protein